MSELASPLPIPEAPPTSKRRMTRSLTVESDGPNVPQLSRWIPVPDIPIWPVLSARSLFAPRNSSEPSILDAGNSTYVMAGRVAIGLALRLAGLAEGDKVLLPAFHCSSMVEPLSSVSASPVFYRVKADLSIDLEDIAGKIDANTRALIATNYFGFPQKLEKLRSFCDDNGLVFIEDCAHSFFGEYKGRPLGSFGHYAVGSLPKFFPVKEGGCLVTSDPKARELVLRRRGSMVELRQIYSTIEDAVYCHRLTLFGPAIGALRTVRRAGSRRRRQGIGDETSAMPTGELEEFDAQWLEMSPSRMSKWFSRRTSTGKMVKRRRDNFHRMASRFTATRGCRPLFAQQPMGVVPYMFPLWVDNLAAVFPKLEDLAMPVQRFGQFLWSGVDETVCPNSAGLSKHLIQLPCHQELRAAELDWMLDTAGEVIASS